MLEKTEIIKAIDSAIFEIHQYIKDYNRPIDSFNGFFQVLNGIKIELINHDMVLNERLLRGFKDICVDTIRNFEDSNFEKPIFFIAEQFSENIPNYKSLELLGMDFGSDSPI